MSKTVSDSLAIFILITLLFAALVVLVLQARTTFDAPHTDLYAVAFVSPEDRGFEISVTNAIASVDLAYEVRNEEDQVLASGKLTVTGDAPRFDPTAGIADRDSPRGRITVRITGPGDVPRELSKVLP